MKSLEDLRKVREDAQQAMKDRQGRHKATMVVAMGTCGIAAGANDVMSAILDELSKRGIQDVLVTQAGCKGQCEQEPMIDVSKPGQPTVTYGYVSPERARTIISQHLVNDNIVGEWVVASKG